MRFGYTGSTIIRLVWLLLLVGSSSAILTTLALGLTGVEYPGMDLPRTTNEQILQVAALFAMWLMIGSPFLTAHEVRAGDVVIRQGILFQGRIPHEEIEAVQYSSRRPLGLGVRWYPDALFVITWPANMVEIRLRRRRIFRLFYIIPLPPVRSIAVNLDDPDGFLAAVSSHLAR